MNGLKGANNTLADALSRHPAEEAPQLHSVTVVHALLAGLWKRLKLLIKDDDEYQELLAKAGKEGSGYHSWKGLVVDDQGRVVIPNDNEIRTLLLSEAHDSPLAGHFGMDKTLEMVQRHWTWKGVQKDVREYVKSCLECQRAKSSTTKPPGELHPIVPSRPWEILTLDFVVGLPEEPSTKFSQVLVLVDKFTKYVLLEPCTQNVTAVQTAQIFVRRIIAEHGVPAVVISDRGPQFTSAVWKEVLKSLGSRVALATTHHPQTDGQTERAIQTLSRLIRTYVADQSTKWVSMLPLFQFALNNSASAVTRIAPFQLLYGREPITPSNLMLDHEKDKMGGLELKEDRRVVKWAREWWKSRRKLCDFVRGNLKQAAYRVKRRYDAKHKSLDLQPGDQVLLSVKSHPAFGDVRKLKMRYTGPYLVKRKVHKNAYELEGLPEKVPATQNVSFLRKFLPTPAQFSTRPNPGLATGPVQYKDHLEWEVETILKHRTVNSQRQYLLKWKDHLQPTWARPEQLRNCAEMLREYQLSCGLELDFWSSSSSLESESGDEDDLSDGETPPLPDSTESSQQQRDLINEYNTEVAQGDDQDPGEDADDEKGDDPVVLDVADSPSFDWADNHQQDDGID